MRGIRCEWRSWLLGLTLVAAFGCGDDSAHEDHRPLAPEGGYPESTCPEQLQPLAQGLEAVGDSGKLIAQLVEAEFVPALEGDNDWTIGFVNDSGEPLADAELVSVQPFMPPPHNHGPKHPPVVMPAEQPGQFSVDRINLWMPGLWEVRLEAKSDSAGSDHMVFRVCIE